MEALEQKVRHILKLQFADEEIEFDRELGTPLLGRIVSEKFEGLDNEARDKMIRTPLRALLTSEERQQILNFLAYTPAEEKMYSEAFDGPPRGIAARSDESHRAQSKKRLEAAIHRGRDSLRS
jgi:acid stress-induced BolA-like protein IbaG/YrbA